MQGFGPYPIAFKKKYENAFIQDEGKDKFQIYENSRAKWTSGTVQIGECKLEEVKTRKEMSGKEAVQEVVLNPSGMVPGVYEGAERNYKEDNELEGRKGWPLHGYPAECKSNVKWTNDWQEACNLPASNNVEKAHRLAALQAILNAFLDATAPVAIALVKTQTRAGRGEATSEFESPNKKPPELLTTRQKFAKRILDKTHLSKMRLTSLVEKLQYNTVYHGMDRFQTSNAHQQAPPYNVVVAGVHYCFAGSMERIARFKSHPAAMKGLSHKLKGLNALHSLPEAALGRYPYYTITYVGHRILVRPVLPVEIGEATHQNNREGEQIMAKLHKMLNTRPPGPWDVQLVKCPDNRFYCTTGIGRIYPPVPGEGEFLYKMFRKEMLAMSMTKNGTEIPISPDAWTPFSTDTDRSLESALLHDLLITGLLHHLVNDLICTSLQYIRENQSSEADFLSYFVVPPREGSPSVLVSMCHARGTNLRYLGLVHNELFERIHRLNAGMLHPYWLCSKERSKQEAPAKEYITVINSIIMGVRTEMISRVVKELMWVALRSGGEGVLQAIEVLFGDETDVEDDTRIAFWFDLVVPKLGDKFGKHIEKYHFTPHDLHRSVLFVRVLQLTGICLSRNNQVITTFIPCKRKFTENLVLAPCVPVIHYPDVPPIIHPKGERQELSRSAFSLARLAFQYPITDLVIRQMVTSAAVYLRTYCDGDTDEAVVSWLQQDFSENTQQQGEQDHTVIVERGEGPGVVFPIGHRLVGWFSRDKSLLHARGAAADDVFLITKTALHGTLCTVLGIRNDVLWVADVVKGLPIPLFSPLSTYAARKVHNVPLVQPSILLEEIDGTMYDASVKSCSRVGLYPGQRILFGAGPWAGSVGVVVGLTRGTMCIRLQDTGQLASFEFQSPADTFAQIRPQDIGVQNVLQPFPESYESPLKHVTAVSFDGTLVELDARPHVLYQHETTLGMLLKIKAGRWLHRLVRCFGIHDGTLWGMIEGQTGAFPLQHSVLTPVKCEVEIPECLGYKEPLPEDQFPYLTCFGVEVIFDRGKVAVERYGLCHQQVVLYSEHCRPSVKGTIVGVYQGELWVKPHGSRFAVPLPGGSRTELQQHLHVQPIGFEVLHPFRDSLRPSSARNFTTIDLSDETTLPSVLSYVTQDCELVGIKDDDEFPRGTRVANYGKYDCTARRDRAAYGVHETYSWQRPGTIATVLGTLDGMLAVHVDGEQGATLLNRDVLRTWERKPSVQVTHLQEADRVKMLCIRSGSTETPELHPSVLSITEESVALHLTSVQKHAVAEMVANFKDYNCKNFRQALEVTLNRLGLCLTMRESEVKGLRKLAVSKQHGAEVKVPTLEEYQTLRESDGHESGLKHHEVVRRKISALLARRRARLVKERKEREVSAKLEEDFRSLQQSLATNVRCTKDLGLTNARGFVCLMAEKVCWVASLRGFMESTQATTVAGESNKLASEPPEEKHEQVRSAKVVTERLPYTGMARYITGEGVMYFEINGLKEKWGVGAGSRVQYGKKVLKGKCAVVLGERNGVLWKRDEHVNACATEFDAKDKEELFMEYALDVVSESPSHIPEADPFEYQLWDATTAAFNIAPSATLRFNVRHGDRYLCHSPPPFLRSFCDTYPALFPPVITIIGTHCAALWYAVSDHSGAVLFSGLDIKEELELEFLYSTSVLKCNLNKCAFSYLGKVADDNELPQVGAHDKRKKSDIVGKWTKLLFDISEESFKELHPFLGHGSKVLIPSCEEGQEQYAIVIGVARMSIWIQRDGQEGASICSPEVLGTLRLIEDFPPMRKPSSKSRGRSLAALSL